MEPACGMPKLLKRISSIGVPPAWTVAINGSEVRFGFVGKSGRKWQATVRDRRLARIVRSCQELPGQHLFQYIGEHREQHSVGSGDVNEYLREATAMDVTAKDFRTWNGTVLAAVALCTFGESDDRATAKANIKEAIDLVAKSLGNTPTICRKCCVHPAVVDAYLNGELGLRTTHPRSPRKERLRVEEAAVIRFLRQRAGLPRGVMASRYGVSCDPYPTGPPKRQACRSGRSRSARWAEPAAAAALAISGWGLARQTRDWLATTARQSPAVASPRACRATRMPSSFTRWSRGAVPSRCVS